MKLLHGKPLHAGAQVAACALVVALSACLEPAQRPPRVLADNVRGVETQLVLSDSTPALGSMLRVLVRVRQRAGADPVASFTAQLAYDSTRLRFASEAPLGDGALRAINPVAGRLRVAAAAAQGFHDGELVAFLFEVLQPLAAAPVHLQVEEMHALGRADLVGDVRISQVVERSTP